MQSDDEQSSAEFRLLLTKAVAGDEAAHGELIEQTAQRLRLIIRRMLNQFPRLRRWEETDDVFQNAVLRLIRSLEQVKPLSEKQCFGLAVTQIRRTLLDFVRHHFGPEGDAANHDSDPGSHVKRSTPNREPETLSDWVRFHEVVEGLPEQEREVFSLVWYGGLTQKSAAEILEVPRRTMIRRMNKARMMLYEAIDGTRPEE